MPRLSANDRFIIGNEWGESADEKQKWQVEVYPSRGPGKAIEKCFDMVCQFIQNVDRWVFG